MTVQVRNSEMVGLLSADFVTRPEWDNLDVTTLIDDYILTGDVTKAAGGNVTELVLTGDVTKSAGSNVTAIGAGKVEYGDMRRGYAQPVMVYTLSSNYDFTTVSTIPFTITNADFDSANIFSNSSGEITVSVASTVRFVVGGYVGHGSGSTEAWANVYVEYYNGSTWTTVGKTSRIFHIPTSNWNSFHVEGYVQLSANYKLRARIQSFSSSDTLRMSNESSFILNVISL